MQKGPEHTAFLAHMRKWDTEQTFAAQSAVEDLLEHRGWRILSELLEKGRESIDSSMKYGQVVEQGEYARRLGVIVGLEAPKAALEAVLLHAERVQKQLESELVEAG